MSDVDDASADASRCSRDVAKPVKRISSQKILERLELIEKKLEELLNKPKQVKKNNG